MQPQITPLARWQRKAIFLTLLLAFLISLPAFIFYSTGYRYDFFAEVPTITATGGIYISADAENTVIYINEKEVTNARVFRQASYIQGLKPQLNRVHVQSPGLHTWVKELLVQPHIVTEAEAFNMPLISQVRPVTEFSNSRGESVIFATTTSLNVFTRATTSNIYVLATSSATSTLLVNSEFSQLKIFFAEKIAADLTRENSIKNKDKATFSFSTTTSTSSPVEIATTTKNKDNLRLYENNGDIYVESLASKKTTPHYFCTTEPLPEFLQSEVVKVEDVLLIEDGLLEDTLVNLPKKCRTEIKMDRQNKAVIDFDFYPGNSNLILLQLEDGIYVVEIDDRFWQNAQRLYEGYDLDMVVYGGNIFVKESDFMFEVLTSIPAN